MLSLEHHESKYQGCAAEKWPPTIAKPRNASEGASCNKSHVQEAVMIVASIRRHTD